MNACTDPQATSTDLSMQAKRSRNVTVGWNPTPEQIAELRGLAAAGQNDSEIGRKLGASRYSIEYARRNNGIATGYVHPGQKMRPADFAELAPTMTQADCAAYYEVSTTVARRWYNELGIKGAKRVYTKREKPNAAPRRIWSQAGRVPMAMPILRDSTSAGQAQLFLQRFGPVFRASTLNPGATGWIMFGRPVSEEDLIANAHRKGFRSEAMAA